MPKVKKSAKKPAKKAKTVKKAKAVKKKQPVKKKKSTKKSTAKRTSKKVQAIPKGYNSVTPYMIVANGAQAIDFYKAIFNAKEVMRMEQPNGKISHAELKFGDTKIMLADECPEMSARSPESYGGSPVSIHLYVKDVDVITERAIAAGARVVRPVANQFYGDRSGTVIDPHGHIWHISTHVEDVSPAAMKKRAAEMQEKKATEQV